MKAVKIEGITGKGEFGDDKKTINYWNADGLRTNETWSRYGT